MHACTLRCELPPGADHPQLVNRVTSKCLALFEGVICGVAAEPEGLFLRFGAFIRGRVHRRDAAVAETVHGFESQW